MFLTAHSWVTYSHSTASRPVWSTENELLFVICLGTWKAQQANRDLFPHRYLAACAHRQDWGRIDVVQGQLRMRVMETPCYADRHTGTRGA
jgi:hypothetical protein